MKKFLILSVLSTAFIAQFANAQVDKGNKMLGGSVGFNNTKLDNTFYGNLKTTHIFLSPKFGFGLSENWILGIATQYGNQKRNDNNGYQRVTNMYGVGVFARKFHGLNDQFGIFGEAGFNYGFGDETTTRESNGNTIKEKSKQQQSSISLHPGVYFKPAKKFFVEASIGDISYTHTKNIPPDGPKQAHKVFNISLVNNLSCGLFLVL